MTDSKKSRRASGKRERLAAAAAEVLHAQGVAQTTLADIAQAAEVPVGNVYYYFKTKDELVEAAIDAHARTLGGMIAALDELPTPEERLKALLAGWVEQRELTARFGCPTGTLASELDKRADGLDRSVAAVMQTLLDWAEQQFRTMGRADARELAVALIASYQGISLLTNTFRDPGLMTTEARRLERWIDSLG
ncbi:MULTISPECIES: TetR/AcrR family transcriptional regulator [Streptomyces]|uniref:TetR family transcriptional regulator n=1 Tax=Streptomyces spororaveus TaxID=284039 RepID=A0ABQ3THW7_9ACTN|nr:MULTISPECIES: TetR/AcrR family transcriptional regulator [Streptomyces]MCM9079669.1 TetR/AcrR family transcriptional regulator [Streptomyces spororaveus]MCX5305917.1 TetR/AcrR family transcriptional regulator [Streptomyces sp. NBC_00160]GHI80003.1 TetR family transcriptional regulator [Streptomyces spororaveus]